MNHPELQKNAQAYTMCAYCPKVCRFACPVSESTHNESTSTWAKMTTAHQVRKGERPLDDDASKSIHACTGCGRCRTFCKHDNDVRDGLFSARAVAVREGKQPAGAASTLATFASHQNPFGHELALGRWKADQPVRYPLFPGCSSVMKRTALVDDLLWVSQQFGAPMGVSRASTRCCGYPLYAMGAHEQFVDHARGFVHGLEVYPELVVMDPGCAFTLEKVYPRFGVKVPSRIRTVYQVLAEHLPHAPRKPPLDEKIGYHDACHLGRGLGEYEPPRDLLRRAVREVGEAPSHHSEAGCSGGGGLLPRTMPDTAVDVARRQANEVAPGGEKVVSACPTSLRMFERGGKASEDLIGVLKRWLSQGEQT